MEFNDHELPILSANDGLANSSHHSSSPELSSPPRSLSDPGSPRANQSTPGANGIDNVQGDVAEAAPKKRKYVRKAPYLPRVKQEGPPALNPDGTVKVKKPRKPRDPNAPPIKRKPKKSDVGPESLLNGTSIVLPGQSNNNISQQGVTEAVPRPIISFFPQSKGPSQSINHQTPQHLLSSRQSPIVSQHQNEVANSAGRTEYTPTRFDPVRDTITQQDTSNNRDLKRNSFSQPQQPSQPQRVSTPNTIASMLNHVDQDVPSPAPQVSSFFKPKVQVTSTSTPATPAATRVVSVQSSTGNASAKVKHNPYAKEYSTPAVKANGRSPLPSAPEPGHITKKSTTVIRAAAKDATPVISSSLAKSANVVPESAPATKAQPTTIVVSPKSTTVPDVTPPPLPGSDTGDARGPTIRLRIALSQPNHSVNFTQLAEKTYGWDAMHPRLAAQRDRLARVAAAGAALEKFEKAGTQKDNAEGDEMSLDLSEGENSNVEMGGMSDGRTGTDGGKKVTKKRKMKEDDYDKMDGFVDDSDMLWEEHAASTRDGFFVYSGPLVTEEDPSQAEQAEPTTKRARTARGRGGKAGAASGRGGAAAGGKTTTAARKPRVTKADKARMDLEKVEREKQGLVATPPGTYNATLLNNTKGSAAVVVSQ